MADILIRGMGNIPVGQEFVIVENIDFERYLYNRETGAAFHLVPLPEGHGELIDKQAFIADIAGFIECMSNVGVLVDGETLWGKLLDALANAKTIVPAEGGTNDGN